MDGDMKSFPGARGTPVAHNSDLPAGSFISLPFPLEILCPPWEVGVCRMGNLGSPTGWVLVGSGQSPQREVSPNRKPGNNLLGRDQKTGLLS